MPYRLCAVIPVYNHGTTVAAVVARLRTYDLPCILVDDGSDANCAAILAELASSGMANLVRRQANGGKGAAVQSGLREAKSLGYTHALQVDADGQHALDDVPAFVAASAAEPLAVICGAPVYGDDMPRSRFYGRWLTHIWVWINTLSLEIRDAMCGFRVYPLDRTLTLLNTTKVGNRMDFDIAVLVHLHWQGTPMRWISTKVIYPENGVSHFKIMQDNILISRMHTRLFFGMLRRAPQLLSRRFFQRAPS